MEKRENLFKRVVKRIENFASFIFKRQTDELPAYTEEEFDKDLTQVLQHKEKGTIIRPFLWFGWATRTRT